MIERKIIKQILLVFFFKFSISSLEITSYPKFLIISFLFFLVIIKEKIFIAYTIIKIINVILISLSKFLSENNFQKPI